LVALYDFSAYRTSRLLDRISQQTGQVGVRLYVIDAKISSAKRTLKRTSQTLNELTTLLEMHQSSCLQSLKRSELCEEAIVSGDIENMLSFREQYLDSYRPS